MPNIQDFQPARCLLRVALALAVCAVPAHSAFALVKCVASDGRVTFQDVLCDIDSTSVAVRKRFGQHSTDKPVHEVPQRTSAESTTRATLTRPAFGAPGGVLSNPVR